MDDRWRDSYDAWQLATPPEYEQGDPPEWACGACAGTGRLINFGDPITCDRCDGTGEDSGFAVEQLESLEEALAAPPRKIDADAEDDPVDLEIVF